MEKDLRRVISAFVFCKMKDYSFIASTGTFIGKANGYDYTQIPYMNKVIKCDGFEFMMMLPWYGEEDKIIELLKENSVNCPTLHTDKYIGVYLEQNKKKDALKIFESNLKIAKRLGSKKVVLHLWSGLLDKSNKVDILKTASEMNSMSKDYDILLTVENIPSVNYSPLELWEEMLSYDDEIKLTFDTRFATYFNENEKIFNSGVWKNVEHIHISSFDKNVSREARIIRPILHPGEGIPDFNDLFLKMPKYRGTITLESPVLGDDGKINPNKLNNSLDYLRDVVCKYTKE